MELALNMGTFEELDQKEMCVVDGGGFMAALYMAAFIAGTTPLGICVGTGLILAGCACCIYGIATH